MKKDSRQRLFEVMGKVDKSFKINLNESIKDNEVTDEGISYKAKLEEIIEFAKQAYEQLPNGQIPSWIQDKIVIAKEHLSGIVGWLHTQEEENETKKEDEDSEMSNNDEKDDKVESNEKNDKVESNEKDDNESINSEISDENDNEKKSEIPVVDIAKVGK